MDRIQRSSHEREMKEKRKNMWLIIVEDLNLCWYGLKYLWCWLWGGLCRAHIKGGTSGAAFPGEDGRWIICKTKAALRMFNLWCSSFWRSFGGYIEIVVGDVERIVWEIDSSSHQSDLCSGQPNVLCSREFIIDCTDIPIKSSVSVPDCFSLFIKEYQSKL